MYGSNANYLGKTNVVYHLETGITKAWNESQRRSRLLLLEL